MAIKYVYSFLLTASFCAIVRFAIAQPIITLTPQPGRCPTNGSITVTATGTTGTVLYSIKKSTDVNYSAEQTTNVFNNLSSGSYTVALHDASGVAISNPATLTNAPYSIMSISSLVSGNFLITGCEPDGSIELTVTGGRPPYTYQLRNGPTIKPTVVDTPGTRVRFVQLASGNYFIDITDSCRNVLTQSSAIVVTSLYNLKDTILASADGLGGPTQYGGNCADSLSFSTNNLSLISRNGTVLFDRNGKHMPANYPIQARVEYPAGSGTFTDWANVFGKFALPNYSADSSMNKYRIQLKHPCNDTNIVTTPVYIIPPPYQSRSGFCTPSLVHTTAGYNCGTVNIHLEDVANSSNVRDYAWDGVGTSFTFDTTGWAGRTFKVFITINGQTYQTANISAGKPVSVSIAADSWDFPSSMYCDFTTGRIRSYLSNFPVDNTIPITYTIVSGPTIRDPITALQPLSEFIWDTLPGGTYVVKVDYGGCRSELVTRTITLPYLGFGADELSYKPGSSCGRYIITGKGWYITPLGALNDSVAIEDPTNLDDTLRAASNLYSARFLNDDGTFGLTSANTISGSPFAITSREVTPGTYRIAFLSSNNSKNHCYYIEKTVTIPPYQPVVVDVTRSGGVACDSLTGDIYIGTNGGTIYISTTGSSIQPFGYRIKPRDSTDAFYTPWQTSPVFEDRPVGVYTAQVFDSCGYTATSDVELLAADTASAINVAGGTSTLSVSQGAVCQYDSISLQLSVIGTATNVRWIPPNSTDTINGNVYTIDNFSSANAGKYYVTYTGGRCQRRDSVTLNFNLAPTFTSVGNSICNGSNIDLSTLVSNISANSSLQFYSDTTVQVNISNPLVKPDSSKTYYIQSTDATTGCKSLVTALPITVNYPPHIGTFVAPPPACNRQALAITNPIVIPQGTPITNEGWTLDGVVFNPSSSLSLTDNGKLLRYFAQSACGDSATAPVTIVVNPKPEFSFSDPDTIAAPNTIDLTTLSLANGDTTGLTLIYSDSVYSPLTPAEIAAAGAGTYHIIGTVSQGCADTSTVKVTVVASALPVGLLYFRVTRIDNTAIITWTTSFEQNSNRFEIEQSTDGSRFIGIGEIKAAGNSTTDIEYSYKDENIRRYGSNRIYYRLKQTDNDGSFTYSGTSLLLLDNRTNVWKAYPIPFNNMLVIDIPSDLNGQVSLEITDLTGRVVYRRQEIIVNAQTNIVLTDLPDLAKGVYYLTINSRNGKTSLKLMKE